MVDMESISKEIKQVILRIYKVINDLEFNEFEMTYLVLLLIYLFKKRGYQASGINFKIDTDYKNYKKIHRNKINMLKYDLFYKLLKDITVTDTIFANVVFLMVQEYNSNEIKNINILIEMNMNEDTNFYDMDGKLKDKYKIFNF